MDEHHDDPDLPTTDPNGEVLPVDLRDWVDFSVEEARRVRVFRTDALQHPLGVLAVGSPPGDLVEPDEPLTRLGAALRERDTTGGIGRRLMAFLQGS